MSTFADRPGTFRGTIYEYSLLKGKESKSLAILVTARLDEIWEPETKSWANWRQYEVVATGSLNVVKKDGNLNQGQIESLIKHAGWNGDFGSIVDQSWQPTECQLVVQQDDYNGETRFRISFVNAYDRQPGMSNLSVDEVKALQAQYGPQIRALAGSAKRNAQPAPAGKPAAPSRPVPSRATPVAPAAPSREPGDGQGDDLPF